MPLMNEKETERSRGIVKEVVAHAIAVLVLASVGVTIAAHQKVWPSIKINFLKPSTGSSNHVIKQWFNKVMNTREDPCTNFYAFVCGNFKSPEGTLVQKMDDEMYKKLHSTIDKFSINSEIFDNPSASQKAASLYNQCKNSNRDKEMNALKEFLEYERFTPFFRPTSQTLDMIVLLFFNYNIKALLHLSLAEDILYNNKRRLRLSWDNENLSWLKIRQLRRMNVFYKGWLDLPSIEIMNAENLVYASLNERIIRGFGDFSFESVKGLERLTPTITKAGQRWTTLVEAHSKNFYRRDHPVLVSIKAMEHFDKLYKDLGNSKLTLLTAWEVVRKLLPFASKKVESAFNKPEFSAMCRNAVLEAMEVPLMSWYLFPKVQSEQLRKAKKISVKIREYFAEAIKKSSWLDQETKQVAILKLWKQDVVIGYPQSMQSNKTMDKTYSWYPTAYESFMETWFQSMILTRKALMKDVTDTRCPVTTTRAFYTPYRNQLCVPATVLVDPFFSTTAPDAVNFGAIGAIIGHEIMHAFTKPGLYYNANGTYGHWWTGKAYNGRKLRLDCLRRKHNLPDDSADNEILADFAGLVAAHDVYKNLNPSMRSQSFNGFPYQDMQLFFMSYCLTMCAKNDTKSPQGYASWQKRCEIPLQMMDDFGKEFRCKAGAKMFPSEPNRCTFW